MARPDPFKKPRLNLGSGEMLKADWVNFDCKTYEKGGLKTNVIGRIEDVLKYFDPGSFMTILCAHVIEHFYKHEAVQVLKDIYTLLMPEGQAILEGPDIIGGYGVYVERDKNIPRYIEMLYPTDVMVKYGEEMMHKSGWTREIMAERMKEVGFDIIHTGIGLTHGMGPRDFRVVGVRRD